MCIWFGYNPQTIFVTFPQVERSRFSCVITISARGTLWQQTRRIVLFLLFLWGWGFYPEIVLLAPWPTIKDSANDFLNSFEK